MNNIKPILLVQFRKSPTQEHEVSCIKNSLLIDDTEVVVTNIPDNTAFVPMPYDIHRYSAVIIGGSSEYSITDWPSDVEQKALKLKPFLAQLINEDKPLLGICFGHQLLAHFFGGKVERDDSQAEGGIVEIELNGLGAIQKLYKNIPDRFYVVSGHKDSVIKLPTGAVLLAQSKRTKVQSYKLGNNVYGVQFHPELDLDALVWRLSLFPQYSRGRSIEEIKSEFTIMPYATKILQNFVREVARV